MRHIARELGFVERTVRWKQTSSLKDGCSAWRRPPQTVPFHLGLPALALAPPLAALQQRCSRGPYRSRLRKPTAASNRTQGSVITLHSSESDVAKDAISHIRQPLKLRVLQGALYSTATSGELGAQLRTRMYCTPRKRGPW